MIGLDRLEQPPADPVVAPAALTSLIAADLCEVEEQFRSNLASPVRIVGEIGGFVAAGGGKRVRPTLHLLSARLCGYAGPHSIVLATVLEFIHSATLIHDDIIDEATTRRGRPSANVRWGNDVTVLFGDYLFAKAMEMALQVESLDVMHKLAAVTLRMTEGEMLQTRYIGRLDLNEAEYLDLIRRKTAALFGCCCELAGMLAGVDAERQRAMRRYGINVGMAFQLVDDLLDFTGDAKKLGKPAANDLSEGKATLAVIDLMQTGAPEARELARRIMDPASSRAADIVALTALLHDRGSIERCRRQARTFAVAAVDELAGFDPGPAHDALRALPDLLLRRDR